jgi:hypothetical protein
VRGWYRGLGYCGRPSPRSETTVVEVSGTIQTIERSNITRLALPGGNNRRYRPARIAVFGREGS